MKRYWYGLIGAIILFAALLLIPTYGPATAATYDILILNGTVVNGTGAPGFRGDVAVKGGKIARVGDLATADAKRIIDATGLVVAPGFIDTHSHSEDNLITNGRAESKIRQGVTTEIVGNCGISSFPRDYNPEAYWVGLSGYFNRLMQQGVSLNVGSWAGQGHIRDLAMGYVSRAPAKEELERMKYLAAETMENGAFGVSTGLIYPPGSWAKTDELIEVVKATAPYGGVYKTHIRGEGDELLEAITEAIEIGERAGVPVIIAHFKCSGSSAWKAGLMEKAIKMINEARARGVNVTTEQYPYLAGSTGMAALVPTWAREGGTKPMLDRLADPEIRKRLKKEVIEGSPGWWNLVAAADGWQRITFASSTTGVNSKYEGKDFVEIARLRGVQDPADACFDMVLEEKGGGHIVLEVMRDEDVDLAMKQPWNAIGSDGYAFAIYGPLSKGKPHPRSYGTFPRVLGVYVRQKGILTLEDAVRKMTLLPAQQLGITDRGKIEVGMAADITIFDPKTVKDVATYVNPHQYPEGIPFVIVNGVLVIDNGEHTGALPGKILKKRR